MINKKMVVEIIFSWGLTPFASGVMSFLAIKLIEIVFK
jgi:phosphate/sulfate permease